MDYLLKIVIFHGYVSHNQMVAYYKVDLGSSWSYELSYCECCSTKEKEGVTITLDLEACPCFIYINIIGNVGYRLV